MKTKKGSEGSGISDLSLFRLSLYLRHLASLEALGKRTVSSKELADTFSVSAALVRKDLGFFGAFGKRGVGYNVSVLRVDLLKALGLNRAWRVAIVGAGRLGIALAKHKSLFQTAFEIAAVFDKYPERATSKEETSLEVLHTDRLAEIVRQRDIKLGIIAVPGHGAQDVADSLVDVGVKAIINFAPAHIKVPEGVYVRNVDFTIYLENLAYYVKEAKTPPGGAEA